LFWSCFFAVQQETKKCCTLRERQALYGKVLKQPAQPSGTSYRYQTLNRYIAYTARLHVSALGRVLNGILNSEQDEFSTMTAGSVCWQLAKAPMPIQPFILCLINNDVDSSSACTDAAIWALKSTASKMMKDQQGILSLIKLAATKQSDVPTPCTILHADGSSWWQPLLLDDDQTDYRETGGWYQCVFRSDTSGGRVMTGADLVQQRCMTATSKRTSACHDRSLQICCTNRTTDNNRKSSLF